MIMPTPHPSTHSEFYDCIAAKRFFAWIIDMVLITVICIVIIPFTAFTGLFFFPFLMLVVGFAYRVATLAGGSATWGMRAMAMELRNSNDQPLDGGLTILHTLGYSISFAFLPLQVISIILMVTSANRQGLTDLVLGTVALNKRKDT
jgi:uncharacterized RDD family membrane protein YckC